MAEEDNGFEVNQHVPVLAVGPELDAHIQRALNFGQGAGNGGVPPPGGNGPAGPNIGVVGNNPFFAQAEAAEVAEAVAAPTRPPGNEPLQGGRKRGRKSRRKSRKSRKSRRNRLTYI